MAHSSGQSPEPALVHLERVTRSSTEGSLHDVSLHVRRGDICGIAAPVGGGASTLLRTMNLLERPDSGAVIVAGRDLVRLPPRDLRAARHDIGMLFKDDNLLQNLTVFDNVGLPLRLHGTHNPPRLRQRVRDCLAFVGMDAAAAAYPARLSGNQRRRVALARALASQPALLLCDEPTAGLDADGTQDLLRILRTANTDLGTTIVIASQDLSLLGALCNRVAVLDAGTVAETFDPADTSAPRLTALGRELAYHASEARTLFRAGALHA
jgi:D-methionine transport system ATP-binding protein